MAETNPAIVFELERTLNKIRGGVLEKIKDEDERAKTRVKLEELDRTIRPMILEMWFKHGGVWTNQRAFDEARRLLEIQFPNKPEAHSYAKYFRYRWGAFVRGLQKRNLYRPESNAIGDKLGALRPITILPPMPVAASDKQHIEFIHRLARDSVPVDQVANQMLHLYCFDRIKNQTFDLANRGALVINQFGGATVMPNQFMHPLFVALGAVRIAGMDKRMMASDMARVVSNRIRGGNAGALMTMADKELYHDLTSLPVTGFCSRNQMEDLYQRAMIHTLYKNEVGGALRMGDLMHSSQRLITALQRCQQSPLQSFKPDNAIDMLWKLVNATSFYPTKIATMPQYVYPNGPIPYGTESRVPFLRVMLPQPGDDRFYNLAENWDPKEQKLKGGADPVYRMKPDKIGGNSWIQTPWRSLHNTQVRIMGSRCLMFVVDRRLNQMGQIPSPFTNLQHSFPYADIYRINRSKVNVQETIKIGFDDQEYCLKSVLALEPDAQNKDLAVSYRSYTCDDDKEAGMQSAILRGGTASQSGGSLFDGIVQSIRDKITRKLFTQIMILGAALDTYLGQIRKAESPVTMTDIVQNIVVILSSTAIKPANIKLPDIVTEFIAKMYPTHTAKGGAVRNVEIGEKDAETPDTETVPGEKDDGTVGNVVIEYIPDEKDAETPDSETVAERTLENSKSTDPSPKNIFFALVLAFMTVASNDNQLKLSKKFRLLNQIIDIPFLKILFDRGSSVGKIVRKAYDGFTASEMSPLQWAGLLAECYELFFDDDEQKRGGATTSPPNMQGGMFSWIPTGLKTLMSDTTELAGLAGIVLIIVILWIFYKKGAVSGAASWLSNNPLTGGNSTWSKYSPVENFKQRKGKVFANGIDFKDVQKDAEEHGILFIYEKKN